jgi:predicted dehydrogenase
MGSYQETYNRVMDGEIGELRAARAYYLTGQLWYREPKPEWSEMEAMVRDWVNWCWLSGDHIVEQFIHNMDNQLWFLGETPVKAVGMGARMRRVTGDQYDFFSVDYEMESGIHLEAKCRQIDGCVNNVSDFIVGTKGATNCRDTIYDLNGEIVWQYDQNKVTWGRHEKGSVEGVEMDNNPYVQEHIDTIVAIRAGTTYNHATDTAKSTLAAIMGREAAYTGREITWEEMEASDMDLGPEEFKMGKVGYKAEVPVPGTERQPRTSS